MLFAFAAQVFGVWKTSLYKICFMRRLARPNTLVNIAPDRRGKKPAASTSLLLVLVQTVRSHAMAL